MSVGVGRRATVLRFIIAILLGMVAMPREVRSQEGCGGSTMTPGGHILVSKVLGGQRWSIVATTEASGEGRRVISISGTVSGPDGTPQQFLYCQPSPDRGPNAQLSDADRGTTNAMTLACRALDPDVCEGSSVTSDACQDLWTEGTLVGVEPLAKQFLLPRTRPCDASGLGATSRSGRNAVSYDEREMMVNKAVGDERWTISLAKPLNSGQFTDADALGTVFFPAGGDPTFLFCRPNRPLQIYVDDSDMSFSCQASGPCGQDSGLSECASDQRWAVVNDNVELATAFFLPPGGSGLSSTGCEYGNDPQTLAKFRDAGCTPDFLGLAGSAVEVCVACRQAANELGASLRSVRGGSCLGSCTIPIEDCDVDVQGQLVDDGDGGCTCAGPLPEECLSCESRGLRAGDVCEIRSTSGRKIVGECQPTDAGGAGTYCLPPDHADVYSCGGPLDGSCPKQGCCSADQADGCGASGISCDGVCVFGDGGACEAFVREQACGDGSQAPGEQCDDGNKVSGDGCSPQCTNEICTPGSSELCQTDRPGACRDGRRTCDSLGLGHGPCLPITSAAREDCSNGLDDDCDGLVDDEDTDDCGPTCGDGRCVREEDGQSCPEDCAQCPNGACEAPVENANSCPADCATCGDGECVGETGLTCPADCAVCGDGECHPPAETGALCAVDCAICGDGECHPPAETGALCPEDCARCGNGIREGDEDCDDGNANDLDTCKNDCTLPFCGNGVVEFGGSEQCDGMNLNGYSCQDFGYGQGVLACSDCRFDMTDCSTCGDDICGAGEETTCPEDCSCSDWTVSVETPCTCTTESCDVVGRVENNCSELIVYELVESGCLGGFVLPVWEVGGGASRSWNLSVSPGPSADADLSMCFWEWEVTAADGSGTKSVSSECTWAPPVCGNYICESGAGETLGNCPIDCGVCCID